MRLAAAHDERLLVPSAPGGDQATLAGVVLEQRAQLPAAAVQPRHHRADRGAHDLGDLLVGEALDVGEVDRDAEVLGDRLQRVLHVGVGQVVERLGLGRLQTGRRVRLGPRELPVLDLLGAGLLRLALLLAVGVDEGVGEDAVEPGLEVRALLELVERARTPWRRSPGPGPRRRPGCASCAARRSTAGRGYCRASRSKRALRSSAVSARSRPVASSSLDASLSRRAGACPSRAIPASSPIGIGAGVGQRRRSVQRPSLTGFSRHQRRSRRHGGFPRPASGRYARASPSQASDHAHDGVERASDGPPARPFGTRRPWSAPARDARSTARPRQGTPRAAERVAVALHHQRRARRPPVSSSAPGLLRAARAGAAGRPARAPGRRRPRRRSGRRPGPRRCGRRRRSGPGRRASSPSTASQARSSVAGAGGDPPAGDPPGLLDPDHGRRRAAGSAVGQRDQVGAPRCRRPHRDRARGCARGPPVGRGVTSHPGVADRRRQATRSSEELALVIGGAGRSSGGSPRRAAAPPAPARCCGRCSTVASRPG